MRFWVNRMTSAEANWPRRRPQNYVGVVGLGLELNEPDSAWEKGKKGEKYNNEEREREAHREPEQHRMLVALCSLTH